MLIEDYPPESIHSAKFWHQIALFQKALEFFELDCLKNPNYTESEKKIAFKVAMKEVEIKSLENEKRELLRRVKEQEKENRLLNWRLNNQGKLTKERGKKLVDFAMEKKVENNTGNPKDSYVVLDMATCIKFLKEEGLMSENVKNPYKLADDAINWSIKICQEKGIFADKIKYIAKRAKCLIIKPNVKVAVRKVKETIKDKIERINEDKSHPDFKNHYCEKPKYTFMEFYEKTMKELGIS